MSPTALLNHEEIWNYDYPLLDRDNSGSGDEQSENCSIASAQCRIAAENSNESERST